MRRCAALPRAHPPLSAPIRFRDRLAHQRIDKLDLDLLWETSIRDAPLLLRVLNSLRDQSSLE